MNDALFLHRIHFAFTITFHYLFPQLTMGLAPLIVVLKTLAIRTGNEAYNESVRFWGWASLSATSFLCIACFVARCARKRGMDTEKSDVTQLERNT